MVLATAPRGRAATRSPSASLQGRLAGRRWRETVTINHALDGIFPLAYSANARLEQLCGKEV